jgi:hypothetical protein
LTQIITSDDHSNAVIELGHDSLTIAGMTPAAPAGRSHERRALAIIMNAIGGSDLTRRLPNWSIIGRFNRDC